MSGCIVLILCMDSGVRDGLRWILYCSILWVMNIIKCLIDDPPCQVALFSILMATEHSQGFA